MRATDHLGSTLTAFDLAYLQPPAARAAYGPYGTLLSSGVTPGDAPRHRFTGAALDKAGIVAMGARDYDPAIGRFLEPDTIVPDLADPQSHHRYAYVQGNPLNAVDPSGRFRVDVILDTPQGRLETSYDSRGGGLQTQASPAPLPLFSLPQTQVLYFTTPQGSIFDATSQRQTSTSITLGEGGLVIGVEVMPERSRRRNHSVGDIDKLDSLSADFRPAAQRVVGAMQEAGWRLRVVWGRRTKQENDKLVEEGTASRTSKHLEGRAVDLISRDVGYSDDPSHPYYRDLEHAVKEEELIWGGDFTERWDPTHFEQRTPQTRRR